MSYWIDDHQLFLYAKGIDHVILRRCKKPVSSSSSSLVVPMKSDDFQYVSDVKNFRLLIKDEFEWEEPDYKRLVKYIYERALLVNGQGLVIAEIYKLDDLNLVVPIYIRSLDVLPLKPYIPNIRERLIPLRTVKCLEDANGKAAAMMEDDGITKLTARVENLEAENNTLDTSVTQLTAGLATITGNVVDLQSKNKTLEIENKTLDSNVKTLEAENKTLDSNVKTLEGKVTKLTADLVTQMNALTTLQQEVKNIKANNKEVWMNDFTNPEWVGVEGIQSNDPFDNISIIGSLGTFTVEDENTNIRASYWYRMKLNHPGYSRGDYALIFLEDLTPNKEKARFSKAKFFMFKSNGKTCVGRAV